jgi:hypothetical protein
LKPSKQKVIIGVVLTLSLVILLVYAILLYLNDNKSKMGIIIAVSVTSMDVFNFLIYRSGMVKSPGGIILLLIINRTLMVGLGQAYWIYGFMILYSLYAITFVY